MSIHFQPSLEMKSSVSFIENADYRKRFDDLRALHWGKNSKDKPITPNFWHSETLAGRVKARGKDAEVHYRRLYSKLCWYSHSGLIELSPAALVNAFCMGHLFAHRLFLAILNLLAEQFQIWRTMPNLKNTIDDWLQHQGAEVRTSANDSNV